MIRSALSYLFIFLVIVSCIDSITLKTGTEDGLLIVDGMITDQDTMQIIKLSRSQTIDNTRVPPAYIIPESGAFVTLIEDGVRIPFSETAAGTYVGPDQYKGATRATYQLEIQTQSGNMYLSEIEIMPEKNQIQALPFEYIIYERFDQNASGNFVNTKGYGFNISVKVSDPIDVRNYYRWKLNGIFEFFSISDNPDIIHCWAPSYRLENKVLVKDDSHLNGQSFTEPLTIIPYDRATYYMVIVDQYSLTENAFHYWNKIRQQQLNTGTIFDPVPSPITGNLYNVNDASEKVLGFFSASSVFQKQVLINRFKESGYVSPSPNIFPLPGNCKDHVPFATQIKPPGFP